MEVRIVAFILFFLTGCSILSDQDENKLTGSWNWVSSQGGFAGHTLTPESTGYTQKLIFYRDRNYTLIKDGEIQKQGTYKIIVSEYDGSKELLLKFESRMDGSIIRQRNDTLRLTDTCFDCYTHIYVR